MKKPYLYIRVKGRFISKSFLRNRKEWRDDLYHSYMGINYND
jgi:hypothetical protein